MHSKILKVLFIVCMMTIFLCGCSEKKINDVMNIEYQSITSIRFADGRGRNKPFLLEDTSKISEFIDYLNTFTIRKTGNTHGVGWIYTAYLYKGDTEVLEITFTDPMILNHDYYKIVKGEIDIEWLDKFMNAAAGW